MSCSHTKTRMWEPHLAGARKCEDCGMVYNPNRTPSWFFEEPSEETQIAILKMQLTDKEQAIQNYKAMIQFKDHRILQLEMKLMQVRDIAEEHARADRESRCAYSDVSDITDLVNQVLK